MKGNRLMTQKIIAVYGSSMIAQDSPGAREAERAGRLLAEAGFAVSNGGYMGAMEACSRGAREADGRVIGVTCAAFRERTPNPYLSEEIETPELTRRIATLMDISDAYMVLNGNIGTLAELFLAWNLVYMGWNKPLIVIGPSLRQAIEGLQSHTEIGEKQMRCLQFVNTVDEAVDWLKRHYGADGA